jgi:hypothetical protein
MLLAGRRLELVYRVQSAFIGQTARTTMPSKRVRIGGPVGSGKTALV